jgi:putative membrane protein
MRLGWTGDCCYSSSKEIQMFVRSHILAIALATTFAGWGLGQVQPQQQPGYPQPVPGGAPRNPTDNPGAVPPLTNENDRLSADPLASDKTFVKDATEANAIAVELGKLAQEKGSSEAVKDFGKRMVETHTQADEELKQAAAKASIEVPTRAPRKIKKTEDKLAKLSGRDFDRAYTKIILSEHKDNVKAFEREAEAGKVPDVRDFAAKTLPKLQAHRKLAEQLDVDARSGSVSKKK